MNFKKFISGISALTIAASAFAGMAVTASAADTAYTENFDNVEGKEEASIEVPSFADNKYVEQTTISAYKISDFGYSQNSLHNSYGRSAAYVKDGKLVLLANADKNTRGIEAYHSFDAVGTGYDVTVEYDWAIGSATGGNQKGDNYSRTYLADGSGNHILEISYYGSPKLLDVNDVTVIESADRNKTVHVKATLNTSKKTISSLVITGGLTYTAPEPIAFMNDTSSVARFGVQHATKATNWANTTTVDNISITYEESKVAAGAINAVNYTDGTNVLGSAAAADIPNVSGKYIGEEITVPYPKYVLSGTTLYEKSVTNKEYRTKYQLTSESATAIEVSGYSASSITDVAFYTEAENITGVTRSNGTSNAANIPTRSSNASAAYVSGDEDVTITTLQPGKYVIKGSMYSGNSGGGTLNFALGNTTFSYAVLRDEVSTESAAANSTASTQYIFDSKNGAKTNNSNLLSSDEITVTTPTALVFKPSGSNTIALDYIYVVKTGEYVAPSANLGIDLGTATVYNGTEGFASTVASAYIATISNTGNAEGTAAKLTVTVDGASKDKTVSYTLATGAEIYVGIILGNVNANTQTVSAAIE